MHKAFIEPLNLPIEAECAWFFLLLRMQHFQTKINNNSGWLDRVENGKSVPREGIEDLYKQIYATIKFIEICPGSTQSSYSENYKYFREKAQNYIIKTLKYNTFIQGAPEKNAFVSSFPNGESDFDAWVANVKQIKTFPDKMGTAFEAAFQVNKKKLICELFCYYIESQNLARSNTAK